MSDDWHDEQRFAAFPLDPYSEIGVARDVSQEELRKKYLDESKKRHPDSLDRSNRQLDATIDLSEPMKRLNQAYDTLNSSEKRARYDRWWDRTNSEALPDERGSAGPPRDEAGNQQEPFVADPWANAWQEQPPPAHGPAADQDFARHQGYPDYPPPGPPSAEARSRKRAPSAVPTRRNRREAGHWVNAGCCLAPAVAVVGGPFLVAATGVATTGFNFVVAISICWVLTMVWLRTLGNLNGSARNDDGSPNRVRDAKLGCCVAPISIAAGIVIALLAPVHVTALGFAAIVGAGWALIMGTIFGLRALFHPWETR